MFALVKQMDVRLMPLKNNSYDLSIDKSTIDALLCGKDSFVNVAKMINEVQRILKVGGYYMIISYGSPENRMMHLERDFLNFEVSIYTIKKEDSSEIDTEKTHYIYLCKKLQGSEDLTKNFISTVEILEKDENKEEEKTIQKINKTLKKEIIEKKHKNDSKSNISYSLDE